MSSNYVITEVSNVSWGTCQTVQGTSGEMLKCTIMKQLSDGKMARTIVGLKFVLSREDFVTAWKNFLDNETNFEAVKKILDEKEKKWDAELKMFYCEANDWMYGKYTREKIESERERIAKEPPVPKKKTPKKGKRSADKIDSDTEGSPAKIPKIVNEDSSDEPMEEAKKEKTEEKKKDKKKKKPVKEQVSDEVMEEPKKEKVEEKKTKKERKPDRKNTPSEDEREIDFLNEKIAEYEIKEKTATPPIKIKDTSVRSPTKLNNLMKLVEEEMKEEEKKKEEVELPLKPIKLDTDVAQKMEVENPVQNRVTKNTVSGVKKQEAVIPEIPTEVCDHCGKKDVPLQADKVQFGSDLSLCIEPECKKKVHEDCDFSGLCKEHTRVQPKEEVPVKAEEIKEPTKEKAETPIKVEEAKKQIKIEETPKKENRGNEVIRGDKIIKKKEEAPLVQKVYTSAPSKDMVKWKRIGDIVRTYFPGLLGVDDVPDSASFNDIIKSIKATKDLTTNKLEAIQNVIKEECDRASLPYEGNYAVGVRKLSSSVEHRVSLMTAIDIWNKKVEEKFRVNEKKSFSDQVEAMIKDTAKENKRLRSLLDTIIREWNSIDSEIKIGNENDIKSTCIATLQTLLNHRKAFGSIAATVVNGRDIKGTLGQNEIINLIIQDRKQYEDTIIELSKKTRNSTEKETQNINDKDLDDLNEQIASLEGRLADKYKEMGEASNEITKLKTKLTSLETQNNEFAEASKTTSSKFSELENKYKKLRAESEETENRFRQTSEEKEELEKKIQEYENTLKGMEESNKKVQEMEAMVFASSQRAAFLEQSHAMMLEAREDFIKSISNAKKIAAENLSNVTNKAKDLMESQRLITDSLSMIVGLADDAKEEMKELCDNMDLIEIPSDAFAEMQGRLLMDMEQMNRVLGPNLLRYDELSNDNTISNTDIREFMER